MTGLTWAPSSCTLPTEQQPLRVAEWDALFAEHLTAATRPHPLGLRLALVADATGGILEQVRDLAAREGGCCSFFTFTLSQGLDGHDADVYLDVEVDAAHEAVLTALQKRADTATEACGR